MDIDDLKCCGNCEFRQDDGKHCNMVKTHIKQAWEYCDLWSFDGFDKNMRKEEDYDGNYC